MLTTINRKKLSYALLALGFLALISFVWQQSRQRICQNINFEIKRQQEAYYITEETLKKTLTQNQINPIGLPVNQLNLTKIEQVLELNPFVQNAEAYTSVIGNLHIEITQRNPILRIINQFGTSYYIDDQKHKIPISQNYTPYLLVANGHITENLTQSDTIQSKDLNNIYTLCKYIDKDEFLKPLIVQIYANANGDLELSTRLWNQTVLIGDTSNLAEKFLRLRYFYEQAPKYEFIDKYKQLIVKYNNQIIAVK